MLAGHARHFQALERLGEDSTQGTLGRRRDEAHGIVGAADRDPADRGNVSIVNIVTRANGLAMKATEEARKMPCRVKVVIAVVDRLESAKGKAYQATIRL